MTEAPKLMGHLLLRIDTSIEKTNAIIYSQSKRGVGNRPIAMLSQKARETVNGKIHGIVKFFNLLNPPPDDWFVYCFCAMLLFVHSEKGGPPLSTFILALADICQEKRTFEIDTATLEMIETHAKGGEDQSSDFERRVRSMAEIFRKLQAFGNDQPTLEEQIAVVRSAFGQMPVPPTHQI